MNETRKDQPKAHPKDAEGGTANAERREREKNEGRLVDETDGKGSGVRMPIPPPPD